MPADGPPQRFLDELGAAFRRLERHGRPSWGYSSALGRLERAVRAGVRLAPPGSNGTTVAAALPRLLSERLRALSGRTEGIPASLGAGRTGVMRAVEAAVTPALAATEEGFAAALEVLRYLSARVDHLEGVDARRHRPIDGMAWLCPPPDLSGWADAVGRWLDGGEGTDASRRLGGEVLVGECGDGALVAALLAGGWRVRGAEPRGTVAAQAAEDGVDVHVGPIAELLAQAATGQTAGIVLAGVVDRAPVDEIVELVALAVDRLAPGAPLVVISDGVANWDEVALDLLPGRPLRAATWDVLLRRAGCAAIETVHRDPAYAVMGRRSGQQPWRAAR